MPPIAIHPLDFLVVDVLVADVLIAGLLAFWSLLALHYVPWERTLGRPLQPPYTYVAGTLAWTSVYAGWLVLRGSWAELIVMAVVIASAGSAVAGAYFADWLLDLVHERRALRGDVADRDRLLAARERSDATRDD